MMIYLKWRVSSFADSLKSLYPFIPPKQPHVTNADKNLATGGRIQGDKRWWWSTSNEECHLLLTHWNHFIPSSPKSTPHHQCRQKSSHLRSHSRRQKMMMISFKWRVSSFADSLESLYPFIPAKQPHVTNADKSLATWGCIQGDERWWWSTSNKECHLLLTHWNHLMRSSPQSNPTSLVRRKTCPPEVAFKATKDDDDLLQMKSVIFCWLTEITLFLHPANQPRVTNVDKSLATWGRIQGDERWWWSTSNEECHLLLTHWNHFIPSSPQSNPTSPMQTKV